MANTNKELVEKQIVKLIAADRIEIPISSMSGKLKRLKPKLANMIDLTEYDNKFAGERCYAHIVEEEGMKARGMSQGIDVFCEKHPQYGNELRGLIAEQRISREPHLYFGMNENARVASVDYLDIMTSLGFSPAAAEGMYEEIMSTSRKISKTRGEERSILIG